MREEGLEIRSTTGLPRRRFPFVCRRSPLNRRQPSSQLLKESKPSDRSSQRKTTPGYQEMLCSTRRQKHRCWWQRKGLSAFVPMNPGVRNLILDIITPYILGKYFYSSSDYYETPDRKNHETKTIYSCGVVLVACVAICCRDRSRFNTLILLESKTPTRSQPFELSGGGAPSSLPVGASVPKHLRGEKLPNLPLQAEVSAGQVGRNPAPYWYGRPAFR